MKNRGTRSGGKIKLEWLTACVEGNAVDRDETFVDREGIQVEDWEMRLVEG